MSCSQASLTKLTGVAPVSPVLRIVDNGGLLEVEEGIELDSDEYVFFVFFVFSERRL